jgi:ribosomal protein S18 acetylase RimI-like enzyme
MQKIYIRPVDALYFDRPNVGLFVDVVYNNFIGLAKYPELKHTKNDIYTLLKSPNMRGYIVRQGKKLIGYLIGEIMILADGRRVFYISYIYIAEMFRKKRLGSKLMELIIENSRVMKFNGVMLICDTEDYPVYDFYQKRGFMLDIVLRRYSRHDVLFLQL